MSDFTIILPLFHDRSGAPMLADSACERKEFATARATEYNLGLPSTRCRHQERKDAP
jgi:hypothetical protein